MDTLNSNWLTEGWVDFEYKKYQLLAYLSKVKQRFDNAFLYPQLSDLVMHYNQLMHFKNEKTLLIENSPKELKAVDLKKMKLLYEQIVKDDEFMREIEDIVEFATPKLKASLEEGKEIFDFVADNMQFDVIGILPLYKEEGYFFLGIKKSCFIYQYHHGVFHTANDTYKGLNVHFVRQENMSSSISYENLKLNLIKERRELPNPATYLLHSELQFPLDETLLPVAKRILLRELSKAA